MILAYSTALPWTPAQSCNENGVRAVASHNLLACRLNSSQPVLGLAETCFTARSSGVYVVEMCQLALTSRLPQYQRQLHLPMLSQG